ncbi:MAG: DUF3817 domain-containing protein [Candidatus Eremiobacteraeota bacterium]|nr:DUF3817 domain-containing protein [Candidatus Eremiobacteraeota bacterium]
MLKLFRTVAYCEGASFLILLLIAMPLKYLYAMPMAVRVVGMTHGLLFIAYCFSAAQVWKEQQWPLRTAALAFISAFLPCGPFIFDRKLLGQT